MENNLFKTGEHSSLKSAYEYKNIHAVKFLQNWLNEFTILKKMIHDRYNKNFQH